MKNTSTSGQNKGWCKLGRLNMYGEFPGGDVVLTASDDNYFRLYGQVLVDSFLYHNKKNLTKLHILVMKPSEETIADLVILAQKSSKFSWSIIKCPSDYVLSKCVLQCTRFDMAQSILGLADKVLIVDIDSICMGEVNLPDEPYGIFLRPYESDPSMAVAAGCTMFTQYGVDFAQMFNTMKNQIAREHPNHWSFDQPALFVAYQQLCKNGKKDDFFEFDKTHMNWDFDTRDCWFWTGKGDRKHNNATYLEEFDRWKE